MGRFLRRLALGVVLIAVLVVGGTGIRVWQVARLDDRSHADVVVVLGAAQYAGRPSPYLEARLAHAKNLYDEGVAPRIITSGGQGTGDTYTEADAGARWLLEQGMPQNRVVAVAEGRSTLGTLRAVSAVASARGWTSAVIVSDPWHSLRARTMADNVGLDAWSSPTRSGPAVWTRETQASYIFRETGALLYYRLSKEPVSDSSGLG
ncbi:MAG: YdcF family protein [Pseudonocardiaceae bacterium]|nr:YdcF family protein [Pseudonocardiaceae bacterium]